MRAFVRRAGRACVILSAAVILIGCNGGLEEGGAEEDSEATMWPDEDVGPALREGGDPPDDDIVAAQPGGSPCLAGETSCNGTVLWFCDDGNWRSVDCSVEDMECTFDAALGSNGCAYSGPAYGGSDEMGAPRFLTLPLEGAIHVVNGWEYSHPPNSIGLKHYGVDYEAATGTPVYAVCSGVAMSSSQYANGWGYGQFLLIRCDQTDPAGQNYFALYGHVSGAASSLKTYPQAERANTKYYEWTPVSQGEQIGWTGSEDTSWAHLHFEIQRGAYAKNKSDPYDLYKPTTAQSSSADHYPPDGALFTGCGANHLWTQCPPVAAASCPGQPSGSIVDPGQGDLVCGNPQVVSGSAHDSDFIQKVTIAVDTLANCKFSQFAEYGDDGGTLAFDIEVDLWSCGLSDGIHTLGLWVLDECGAAVLVDSVQISYSSVCAAVDECVNGPCCSGGQFEAAGSVCEIDADLDYGCPWGVSCGDDVGVRTRDRYCSGQSASCDGTYGDWKGWEVADYCGAEEICTNDDPTCNDASSCQEPKDECSSGPCCAGGQYKSSTVVCAVDADQDYGCPWGTGCGDDVGVRYRDRHCSGSSASCDGDYGSWKGWETEDYCNTEERCGDNDSSCNSAQECVTDPCDSCGFTVSPSVGTWTPSFTENTDCSCSWSNPSCHALYRAKVTELSGNTATIRFKKTTGGGPSLSVKYWIVVADVSSPDCGALGIYAVRKQGWWSGGELEVDVPVWPDTEACEDASEGDYKKMFVITGGKDHETEKIWFQKTPILFTRTCN